MKRTANAVWKGSLTEGSGTLDTQSGAFSATPYSFKGRFQDESGKSGTNPEELIAAAHAGCFAMQLSHFLAENGILADQPVDEFYDAMIGIAEKRFDKPALAAIFRRHLSS